MRKNSLLIRSIALFSLGLMGAFAGPGIPRELGPAGPIRVQVQPETALMGTPFSLVISGLNADEQVTVKARSTDGRGRSWESSAVFKASASGNVDVSVEAPLSGSYAGADVFGLLWSMKPPETSAKRPPSYAQDEVNGWTVDFTALDASGHSATARLRRVYQMPGRGLVRLPLEKDGLKGFLYYPAEGRRFPGVLILGGSNGGLYEWLAQALASNGFAALTLAYFRYPGLPSELVEIPLDYFHRAAAWLKGQPMVVADRIGLVGGSKGGELALLLASRFDDFRVLVAWTPAAHVWEGLSQAYFSPDYKPRSSWSFQGQALPFVEFRSLPEEKEQEAKGELNSFIALHQRALARTDPAALERAAIPVEKIRAPLLLISGTLDQTWPADEFCRTIAARLRKSGFPYEVKHVSHEDAGHGSFLPYLITANTAPINGGTDRANASAGFDSWKQTIAFLSRYLGR
ncbi:MAG TPA: acyl-CoA thioesterase/bile acid-CoA:amino acid N-acyltransferase family protein [Acidobacteriota bacterium]|nr:acyl-CoA thioesterase/bile acid-CoA:amino acid N-acyltransferase family protein [Acidobacteriota bacterium]